MTGSRYTSAAVLLDRVRDQLTSTGHDTSDDDVCLAMALKIELTKGMLMNDEVAVEVCAVKIEEMARRVCPAVMGGVN